MVESIRTAMARVLAHVDAAHGVRRSLAILVLSGLVGGGLGCNLFYDLNSVERPGSIGRADGGRLDADTCCQMDGSGGQDGGPRPDGGPTDVADVGDATDTVVRVDGGDTFEVADGSSDTTEMPDVPGVCEVDQGALGGACDPVAQSGCPGGQTCGLSLVTGGSSPHFESTCQSESSSGQGGVGDGCVGGSDCSAGLFCIAWESPDPRGRVCSQPCDRDTGQGCRPGEFCTNPYGEELDGLGFCTATCAASHECPSGQTCSDDPNFPDDTCEQHKRCLEN